MSKTKKDVGVTDAVVAYKGTRGSTDSYKTSIHSRLDKCKEVFDHLK